MSTADLLPMNLGTNSGDQRSDVPPSPDNPQETTPEQSLEQLGISEEDKGKLVSIITMYRTGWAPDRLLRMPDWMRNDWMFRGRQILGWDQQGCCWYDALAEYMQAGQPDGDASYLLDRFKNNITKMLGTAFVGTMSRSIPPIVIQPENAEIEADVTTAKAAGEAITIIERFNNSRGMVRSQNTKLYLFGCYGKHTRTVIDGAAYGYDEQPEYGDVPTVLPDRYRCVQCGKDTPRNGQPNLNASGPPQAAGDNSEVQGGMAQTLASGLSQQPSLQESADGQAKSCNGCGAPLSSANFYPSEVVTEEKQVGTKRIPRAMVKWSVHGPLEVDADPMAKKISDSPIVALDMEIDIGTARRTFKASADKIKEGAETTTTPNAGFERLRRQESYASGNAYTADSFNQKPTYSQVWMQPDAYYRDTCTDKDDNGLTFSERMMEVAPEGLKISMVGDEVVDVRQAVLEKEWTWCVLLEDCGLYPPSPADDVVGFNVRINGAMDIIDAHYETSASGIVFADSGRIDRREWADKKVGPGVINFVKIKNAAQDTALSNVMWQLDLKMDQGIISYIPMLASLAQQIANLPPQIFGVGTQPGVETKGGQAQQLDQAQIALNQFFEAEKTEMAEAAQNAIEELQKDFKRGLIKEIWDVVESNGSQFRNKYVDLQKMNGKVRISAKTDQGLPQSPEQQRQAHELIVKEAGEGNPLAMEVMDCTVNQEIILASLCGTDMVLPAAAQRSRTLQHISTLLETPQEKCPLVVTQDQQTGQPTTAPDLPVKPAIGTDNWKVLQATIKLFNQENWDQATGNPFGFAQLDKYRKLAQELEVQEAVEDAQRKAKVTQAGAPGPDPAIEQAKQALLKDGADSAARLEVIGAIDPALALSHKTGGALPAVISANKELLDTSLKAATAQ
jgi:hypothetical protein